MKHLQLLLILGLCSVSIHAQTLLFGGATGNGDFENGSNGWVLVNGSQTNKWVVSNNATAGFSGTNSIYISSSATAPYVHNYNVSANTYAYFYKDVAIPAGTKQLWLVFDYIANGEWVNDAFGTIVNDGLRIYARDVNTQVTAGQELPGSFFLSGAYYNQPTWKRKQVRYLDVSGYAGSTMRIVFQWNSNNSAGNQPPAALDNIELYAGCQEMGAPSLSTVYGNFATLVWNTVAGATGYQVRFRKIDEPTTVPTYTNPVTFNGASTYYGELTGLTPGTTYFAEIRPVGTTTPCNEFSAPLTFTTLPPPLNDDCDNAISLTVENNACPASESTIGTFLGATPTAGISESCSYNSNNDVWYKFVATGPQQIIQTYVISGGQLARGISLYTGVCNNLQAVPLACASDMFSPVFQSIVSRLAATGLTVGTTYYIRIAASSNSAAGKFAVCVYNPPPAVACPVLLSPANTTTNLAHGTPQEFKWRSVAEAKAYRLRIIQQSGAYAEIYTTDTSYTYTLSPGLNYTWNVMSYNIQDQLSNCSNSFSFTTCPEIANSVVISATSSQKCKGDSVKLVASTDGTNYRWFLNGQLIPGATADSLWVIAPGNYTLRQFNGTCYSSPTNTITVTNLATPSKPTLSAGSVTTFCEGGSVTLTASMNANNQWFNNTTAISAANGTNYTANQSGNFFVRVTNNTTGCHNYSDTISIIVNRAPVSPSITPLSATTFCAGDSVKLESSIAQGLQWWKNGTSIAGQTSQQLKVTQAGTYTVTTSQNGCTSLASASVSITVNPIPTTPSITTSGNLAFCTGDSISLQSSAVIGNQWFKNNIAINNATTQQFLVKEAATYTVKTTTNGCVSNASAGITTVLNPLPAQPGITGIGSLLSAPAGYLSYQWYLNNVLINGAAASQYTTLQNGLYKVEVTNNNGCKSMSQDFNQVSTAINEIVWAEYSIKFYPNPLKDKLNVLIAATTSTNRNITAQVIDAQGKIHQSLRLKSGNNVIYFNGLPAGIYTIVLKSGVKYGSVKVVKTN